MITYGVPRLGGSPQEFWILFGGYPDDKKRRARLVSSEDLQQAWGEIRMWPIVKGKRYIGFRGANMRDGSDQLARDK